LPLRRESASDFHGILRLTLIRREPWDSIVVAILASPGGAKDNGLAPSTHFGPGGGLFQKEWG